MHIVIPRAISEKITLKIQLKKSTEELKWNTKTYLFNTEKARIEEQRNGKRHEMETNCISVITLNVV